MGEDTTKDSGDKPDADSTKSGDNPKTGGRVTLDDVKQVVDDALAPIKEALSAGSDTGTKDETGSDDGGTKQPRTRRDLSQMAEDAVKAAAAKLKHDEQHASLQTKEKEEKKETETPPVKTRWSTRIMGW